MVGSSALGFFLYLFWVNHMKLAIDGGLPVRIDNFPAWPQYDKNEEVALIRSLRQGQWWRVSGHENTAFEKEFAAHHGCEHAVTIANGTVALELSLLALGIGPGDEVIVPAFTFISTSMACQKIGAVPIPVDVLASTYCIDPRAVGAAITPRTKAIIPVHMSGHFCDMEALQAIARKHDLTIVQDAAHAHGARGQDGKRVGEWNTLACFSFQNFKLMTAGEGGIVLCPSQELRERVFLYSNCGRPQGDRAYQHTVVGTNARLSEFSAAVLRAQLTRLDQQTQVREANASVLNQALSDLPEIDIQQHNEHATLHPHYMYMLTLKTDRHGRIFDRNRVVDCLIAEGIPAFRAYQALYRIPSFWIDPAPKTTQEALIRACPATENIAGNGIWIHHRALLGSRDDTLSIVQALRKVLDGISRS
ncbi:MAG TPA: aminotransferase class I/II-fold pyridoxal phosphate-dependent enzyme [Noviherbaspirillum sp.]